MIIGKKLEELKLYQGISANLDEAISFILNNDLSQLAVGKYPIKDKEIYLNREDYEPRDISECSFEGHKNYLDIQIVLSGEEGFGYTHSSNPNLLVTQEYNSDKDVAKFQVEPELIFNMNGGSFAIVFPDDLHMPKIKITDNVKVTKAIIKVML